jgi:tetratricopeptide (TPR) repeat protein
MGMGAAIQVDPLRAYTLGILSLRLGDTASAVDAAEQLRRLAASDDAPGLVRDLDRGLRARLAARAGHPEEALHLLESLELGDSQGEIAVTPFVSRASERFLRGEVLTALKRYAEALPWFEALGYGSVTEIPLRAPSHLRQAELHDRLGHRAEAALHYARFLELRQEADAGFQREVAAARQRLAELSRPN